MPELPVVLVSVWKKAGASVGWIRVGGFGQFGLSDVGISGSNFGKGSRGLNFDVKGEMPAFSFSGSYSSHRRGSTNKWELGFVADLPQPQTPFGLDLTGTTVTEAGLKELAGLKNLQALRLADTQVTNAGLKELAGLKNLQLLDLYDEGNGGGPEGVGRSEEPASAGPAHWECIGFGP